jgi:squalene-hopene/tetraprenyl-beta-curcumene cyclase
MNASELNSTLSRLTQRLLDARQRNAYWTGELSDSALSTATAAIALYLADSRDPRAAAGLEWLEHNQNPDGGFGDTIYSVSNISTTALCWAAFTIAGTQGAATERAGEWLRRAAGGLQPEILVKALATRYGLDRTFSVPILTVLAVAGIVPWRMVPQLPFEMAACPRGWFARLGLPVVSYALPALIAIGQARHRRQPSRNPATRLIRTMAANRTLRILEQIQPISGGYLEATPLTGFVCISLLAAGISKNPVLTRGLDFLRQSVRSGGSWPIDTNVATWLTTLSVNALRGRLPEVDRDPIIAWLLNQQSHSIHAYTGAAPGGWAWTDLPGGVPDADDTAGALLALDTLGSRDSGIVAAATSGVLWLLGLQNRDGGVPTFCRGWGKLPFDRSSCDITAHALQAWLAWRPWLRLEDQSRVGAAVARAVKFLEGAQRPDGAWTPLWFGNQLASKEENPVYGTARVLLGMQRIQPESAAVRRAVQWMLASQNQDGGWGGERGLPSSIEETALAVSALADATDSSARLAVLKGVAWIVQSTQSGEKTPPSPIGLYFARLWYYESHYPLIFALDALRRVAERTP